MTGPEVPFVEKFPVETGHFPGEEHSAPGNTPGAAGYVLAVLLSWVLICVGLALTEAISDLGPGFRVTSVDLEWLVVGPVIWGLGSAYFVAATAPVGVVLLHFGCRSIRQQWVHVLVTAVLGTLAVYAVAFVIGEVPSDWDKVAAGVGFCTAVGRAAVIPMVPAVRLRRLQRRSVT